MPEHAQATEVRMGASQQWQVAFCLDPVARCLTVGRQRRRIGDFE